MLSPGAGSLQELIPRATQGLVVRGAWAFMSARSPVGTCKRSPENASE